MATLANRKITYTDIDKSGFGETVVVQKTPTIQFACPYGIFNSQVVQNFTSNGTITASGGEVILNNDTGVGDYASMLSLRNNKYRAGESSEAIFDALFDSTNAVANSLQLAGIGTAFNGFFYGYNGANFGIMHRYDGLPEIYRVTVSSAFTGIGTVTLTLNSVAYSITTADATSSTSFSAHQIEAGDDYSAAWDLFHTGADVYFIFKGAGDKTGTFSIDWDNANTGGNGTLTKIQDGVAATEDWTYQADWNIDPMDGTGRSRMTLDTSKYNYYKIQYDGTVNFYMADDSTGELVLVHQLNYPNTLTTASVDNYNIRMLYAVASLGSTTALTMKMSHFGTFIDGKVMQNLGSRYSVSNSISGITTEQNILTLLNPAIYNNVVNQSHLYLNFLSISVDGTKNSVVKIYKNGTIGANTLANYTDYSQVSNGESCSYVDTTADTITSGQILYVFNLGKTDSKTIDLTTQNIQLLRTETFTITCTSSETTECFVSLNYFEDY